MLGPILFETLQGGGKALQVFSCDALLIENGYMPFIDSSNHRLDLLALRGEAQAHDAFVLGGALVIEIAAFDELGDRVAQVGSGVVTPDPEFGCRQLSIAD